MAVGSERGTTNLDVLAVDQLFVAGTITGSVQNTGTESSASEVLTSVSCPGTITGSQIVGTFSGIAANDTVDFASLKGTSFYALVGTIVGSQAHGLGVAPTSVQVTPVMDFGTFGAPYQRAAAGTLECYVSAGTVGTVQITALA